MSTYLKAWQRNGTRRPFPAMYEAQKMYGEKVWYKQPDYVEPKHCRWCNAQLTGRRKSFCCNEHRIKFNNITVWNRGRDPYSLRILYRDNFTCQHCGTFHAFINEYGVACPIDDGQLNVHHIKFVCDGGGDEPDNLMTLCVKCHRELHKGCNNEK